MNSNDRGQESDRARSTEVPRKLEPDRGERDGKMTNTPQHLVGEQPEIAEGVASGVDPGKKTRQTGTGTSHTNDVADPHPSDEEHYDLVRHPGGANPPTKDIGPNPSKHQGAAPPRPHNAGSGPE
jgi:hypothetical protein